MERILKATEERLRELLSKKEAVGQIEIPQVTDPSTLRAAVEGRKKLAAIGAPVDLDKQVDEMELLSSLLSDPDASGYIKREDLENAGYGRYGILSGTDPVSSAQAHATPQGQGKRSSRPEERDIHQVTPWREIPEVEGLSPRQQGLVDRVNEWRRERRKKKEEVYCSRRSRRNNRFIDSNSG